MSIPKDASRSLGRGRQPYAPAAGCRVPQGGQHLCAGSCQGEHTKEACGDLLQTPPVGWTRHSCVLRSSEPACGVGASNGVGEGLQGSYADLAAPTKEHLRLICCSPAVGRGPGKVSLQGQPTQVGSSVTVGSKFAVQGLFGGQQAGVDLLRICRNGSCPPAAEEAAPAQLPQLVISPSSAYTRQAWKLCCASARLASVPMHQWEVAPAQLPHRTTTRLAQASCHTGSCQ